MLSSSASPSSSVARRRHRRLLWLVGLVVLVVLVRCGRCRVRCRCWCSQCCRGWCWCVCRCRCCFVVCGVVAVVVVRGVVGVGFGVVGIGSGCPRWGNGEACLKLQAAVSCARHCQGNAGNTDVGRALTVRRRVGGGHRAHKIGASRAHVGNDTECVRRGRCHTTWRVHGPAGHRGLRRLHTLPRQI